MRALISLVLLVVLSSCSTSHPGVVQSPSEISVPPGKAKLVITRNTDKLFMGVQSRVDVNGERVAELWRGESYVAAVQPGKVSISTDAWSSPGRFLAHFDIAADTEYIFEISPNSGHMNMQPMFGIVGALVEAAIEENTGAFMITLKETNPLK